MNTHLRGHTVVVIPGLLDQTGYLSWLTHSWPNYGITPLLYPMPWEDHTESIQTKLERLILVIDTLVKNKQTVSLLGVSAGGSAVVNAFAQRKNKIHAVISICGRLRSSGKTVLPFSHYIHRNKSFYASVFACEAAQQTLSQKDRQKILTLRPLYDEIVPVSTMTVAGSHNIRIPTAGHVFNCVLAFILKKQTVIDFLNR